MAHLLLIDASNVVKRAYHGIRPRVPRDKQVEETPPVADDAHVDMFRQMVAKAVRVHRPTHVALAFDAPDNFRQAAYPGYKASRKERKDPSPSELLQPVRACLYEWGLFGLEADGYEADDVIATLVTRARAAGSEVSILSNDSDLYQLVGEGVRQIRSLPRDQTEIVTPEWVREKIGISPEQVPTYKALSGDKADDIPRVGTISAEGRSSGITKEKAASYLRRFGDLDGIYGAIEMLPGREGAWLEACREQVYWFRDLVALRTDADLGEYDARLSAVRHFTGAHYRAPALRG